MVGKDMKYTLDERLERARSLHKEGYNCSQCVMMVFDDVIGVDATIAARVAAGLGGGVGGQRQACGAITAMSMVIGATAYNSPKDKQAIYADVQMCSNEFKEMNDSIVCGELLAARKKPCMALIEDAITITDHKLRG